MAVVLTRLTSRAVAAGLAVLMLVACSTGNENTGGGGTKTITQWVAWGGDELKAYREVLKPFESRTGIHVRLTTNRESTTAIANGIDAGTELPDVAPGPTDPIQLKSWVTKGALKPMETILGDKFNDYKSNTYPALVGPAGANGDNLYIGIVGGKHYMLMIKTQVKGLFWYNKKVFNGQPPKSFDDLLAIKPSQYQAKSLFCAGFESGGDSGWPASDQIDNIIMRQSGEDVYTKWIQGTQKFTSPEIKLGYQTFLKEVAADTVYGGPNSVLSTAFQKAGDPLFNSPPGCLFLEQATFIANFFHQNKGVTAGTDFDFFAHPSINSQYDGNINGFYDNMAVYNDTDAVRQLMQYLSTKEAQQIWVDQGGTLGGIKSLQYKDPIYQRAAEVAASAKNLLVTAGDFMPTDMRKAFWKSLLNVTRNPASLDSELAKLDQVQAASYKSS